IEDPGLRHRSSYGLGLRPALAAVKRPRHELEGVVAGRGDRPDAEDIGRAVAIGANGAAVGRIALTIVRGRGDLLSRPGVAAVVGDRDDERRGRGVAALLLSAECGPAEIHVAEERTTRGVVRPD